MGRWLDRYQAGDRIIVWSEIASAGSTIRDTADWEDAEAVARETMNRARSNVELLAESLPTTGFAFERPPDHVVNPPRQDDIAELDRFEREVGPVPLALRTWMEVVGQVDLNGSKPAWNVDVLDPLMVEVPMDYVWSEHSTWSADRGTEWDQGSFRIEIAPDGLHKANISGGPPYSMTVPDGGADALLLWEPHQTTFVNYLRQAFRWAGLPGWDPASGQHWSSPPKPFPSELSDIARSLMPI
jgi:hypothetical protein